MTLATAVLLFLTISYIAGGVIGAMAIYFGEIWARLVCSVVGVIALYCTHTVLLNSLRVFFSASIEGEANHLIYQHAEQALTLLAKKKYEDLKLHLIDKSADADEVIRNINLEYGGAPVEYEE